MILFGTTFSDEALDFIDYLLTVDEELRSTMEEALKHPWLQTYSQQEFLAEEEAMNPESACTSLNSLKRFTADSKLK